MKVTIKQASEIMGCSEQFIRIGLQQNRLDIGDAVKMSGRWTYNISPHKLAERQGMSMEEIENEILRILPD